MVEGERMSAGWQFGIDRGGPLPILWRAGRMVAM